MRREDAFKTVACTLAIVFCIYLGLLVFRECKKDTARRRKQLETSATVVDNAGDTCQMEVVKIDGYIYYKGSVRRLAPTPETIKQCIREVLDERKGSQGQNH